MTRRRVVPPRFDPKPAATMGYAHGIQAGNTLWISGQVARTPAGVLVGVGDPEPQARQAFENVREIVESAGGSLADVVNVTIYVTQREYCEVAKRVRREFFRDIGYPTAAVLVVAGLAQPEYLVEVTAVAVLEDIGASDA